MSEVFPIHLPDITPGPMKEVEKSYFIQSLWPVLTSSIDSDSIFAPSQACITSLARDSRSVLDPLNFNRQSLSPILHNALPIKIAKAFFIPKIWEKIPTALDNSRGVKNLI